MEFRTRPHGNTKAIVVLNSSNDCGKTAVEHDRKENLHKADDTGSATVSEDANKCARNHHRGQSQERNRDAEWIRHLTVKLRGRVPGPNGSRGRTMPSRARGDTTGSHGTLERLLAGMEYPDDDDQEGPDRRDGG